MSKKDAVTKPTIKVDLTKSRDKRPLTGLDIEQWRGEYKLVKYDASHALGFRNTNHYNEECRLDLLRLETEVLLRIYLQYPGERSWQRYELPELFDMMYGKYLRPFIGTELETWARVDLSQRFTQLFGKTTGRHYEWLSTKKDKRSKANAFIDVILSKLKTVPDPVTVLENTAKQCLALRGIDLDAEFPIPTPRNPPTRAKTGRRPSGVAKSTPAKRRAAAKKPVALPRWPAGRDRAAPAAGKTEQ